MTRPPNSQALSPPAGGPRILVRARDFDVEDAVELSVEDDGDGVPERALQHLFEKFYQSPRADGKSRSGMGIGLTVVAGLAHAMGATVRAERGLLGGLAVVVTLRLSSVPQLDSDEQTNASLELTR